MLPFSILGCNATYASADRAILRTFSWHSKVYFVLLAHPELPVVSLSVVSAGIVVRFMNGHTEGNGVRDAMSANNLIQQVYCTAHWLVIMPSGIDNVFLFFV